jgi:hypothetical protein
MLTENQQQLISQITEEFISHNQSKRASRGESLLGVDDIINSVQRKRDEIARIKKNNEAILEALKPVFEENFEALAHELNALGLSLKSKDKWTTTYDGRSFITMKVSMLHDRNSDLDFYVDARIECAYGSFTTEIVVCEPKLQYVFNNAGHTFEGLCKNTTFINRIKNMYENKTK